MSQQKKRDPYLNVKYIAYCISQLPPEGVPTTMEDFINYAKFQLSVDKHVLLLDPMWDKYTDEMILVEYFANLFSRSKEKVTEFELGLDGTAASSSVDDFNTWAEKQIAKNQVELEEKAKNLEDHISFSPETMGE